MASRGNGGNVGEARLTAKVVVTCLVAASGGLLFGYDIGISGGVTAMKPFLEKFFPMVVKQGANVKPTVYCQYDSHILSAFTSSLYIAGLFSSMMASRLTAAFGRKFTMVLGGITFLIGGVLMAAAEHVAMLILGRLFLGFGIGFSNQATPLYLAEIAPAKWRGALNIGFHLFIGFGGILAGVINIYAGRFVWGWRLSLGMAVVPALIMMLGTLFIAESPSSLVERGRIEEAKKSLIQIRGVPNVDSELAELIKASELAKIETDASFLTILRREYRPQMVISFAIPFFQQISGIGIIAYYAPAILSALGMEQDAALSAALFLGLVNIFGIFVSTFLVDRLGRRVLLLQGSLQMLVPMVAMGVLLQMTVGSDGTKTLSKDHAMILVICMSVFCAGFGWSWGPLLWVIPSEISPLKIRAIGQSINVGVNLGTTFLVSQTFLSMLCRFTYGAFYFFAFWVMIMTLFVALLLPETKGIHIDAMDSLWQSHWFWRRYVQRLPVANDADSDQGRETSWR